MSLTIENRRFYCTTSETEFGPKFDSDDEGERFRSWMYKNHGDPRQYQPLVLNAYYTDWKSSEAAPSSVQAKFTHDELEKHAGELAALGMCCIDRPLWEGRREIILYIEKYFARASSPSSATEQHDVRVKICAEIQEIMQTYREQEKTAYGVDTPGGLEHMGDVWRLLRQWDEQLEVSRSSAGTPEGK